MFKVWIWNYFQLIYFNLIFHRNCPWSTVVFWELFYFLGAILGGDWWWTKVVWKKLAEQKKDPAKYFVPFLAEVAKFFHMFAEIMHNIKILIFDLILILIFDIFFHLQYILRIFSQSINPPLFKPLPFCKAPPGVWFGHLIKNSPPQMCRTQGDFWMQASILCVCVWTFDVCMRIDLSGPELWGWRKLRRGRKITMWLIWTCGEEGDYNINRKNSLIP